MPNPTPTAGVAPYGAGRLAGLQYLRAVAALAVLLYHMAYYTETIRGDDTLHVWFDARFGLFGVTLFFVISGYLMGSLAGATSPGRFLNHRIIRIYPVYWLVLLGALAAKQLLGEDTTLDPLAFLLIPGQGRWYVLGIEWTLPFEILFYVAVFAVVLARATRWLPWIGLAWLACLVLARLLRPEWDSYSLAGMFPTLSYLLFAEKSLGFVLGMLLPALQHRLPARALCLAGAAALVLYGATQPLLMPWMMAAGCTLLVGGAVTARPAGPGHGAIMPLLRLGDWSFVLYLVHVPVGMAVLRALPPSVGPVAAWTAAVLAGLLLCTLLGPADLRLYRVLKRAADTAAPWRRTVLNGGFLAAFLGLGVMADLQLRQARDLLAEASTLGASLAGPEPAGIRAARLGLRPDPALLGYLDQLSLTATGEAQVQGWALDHTGLAPAPLVLFFADGAFLGAAAPDGPRPDVLEAIRPRHDSKTVSFLKRLPAVACAPGARLEALIVAGWRYGPLTLPPPSSICGTDG